MSRCTGRSDVESAEELSATSHLRLNLDGRNGEDMARLLSDATTMDTSNHDTVTLTLESDLSIHLAEEDQTKLGVQPGDRLVIQRHTTGQHVLTIDRPLWERFSVGGDSPYVVDGQ